MLYDEHSVTKKTKDGKVEKRTGRGEESGSCRLGSQERPFLRK